MQWIQGILENHNFLQAVHYMLLRLQDKQEIFQINQHPLSVLPLRKFFLQEMA